MSLGNECAVGLLTLRLILLLMSVNKGTLPSGGVIFFFSVRVLFYWICGDAFFRLCELVFCLSRLCCQFLHFVLNFTSSFVWSWNSVYHFTLFIWSFIHSFVYLFTLYYSLFDFIYSSSVFFTASSIQNLLLLFFFKLLLSSSGHEGMMRYRFHIELSLFCPKWKPFQLPLFIQSLMFPLCSPREMGSGLFFFFFITTGWRQEYHQFYNHISKGTFLL